MFTLHKVSINLPRGKSLKLVPFGDVHEDSELCDKARWRDFLGKCKEQDDAYTVYIEMGDPNEFASQSERVILGNPKLHESTRRLFEREAMKATNKFISDILFMKGRMLGVLEGNHRWEFGKETSDQRIARALRAKFLGNLCLIRLAIKQGGIVVNVDVVAHHGKAGGKTVGATLNQLDDLRKIFPMADVYCMGHDHRRGIWPESTLLLQNSGIRGRMILKQKRQLLCRTGSFLCGYVDGEQSYVADALLRPCELGTIKLDIRIKRSRIGGIDSRYPDIHGSV